MNRVLLIIVILYVLFGVWVASELPDPNPIVPAAVPIEAGPIAGEACRFPEWLRQAAPRVIETKKSLDDATQPR